MVPRTGWGTTEKGFGEDIGDHGVDEQEPTRGEWTGRRHGWARARLASACSWVGGVAGRAARLSPIGRVSWLGRGRPGWHGQAHQMGRGRAKKEVDQVG